jgi:hypothetical protein
MTGYFAFNPCRRLAGGTYTCAVSVFLFFSATFAEVSFGAGPYGLGQGLLGLSAEGSFLRPFGSSLEQLPQTLHLSIVPNDLGFSFLGDARRGIELTGSPVFGLYESGAISTAEALERLVGERLGPYAGAHASAQDDGTYLLKFHSRGIPLCFGGVRGRGLPGQQLIAMGTVPVIADAQPQAQGEWPDLAESQANALETLGDSWVGGSGSTGSASRCFALKRGTLRPVWRMSLALGRDVYSVYGDNREIYAAEADFYHAAGTARVYPYDSVSTPTLVTENLQGLSGTGELASAAFKVNATIGTVRAVSAANSYIYDVNAPEFEETSAFVNATKHLRFLESLGFGWYGPRPLIISLRRTGFPNNARFLVTTNAPESLPVVEIGKGDGITLKNLGVDAGVVSHELGHFAIYRNVTKTSGESFVLHEGLADYLEAARSGDGCLGDSLCPAESKACMIPAKCLRIAANNFRYQDPDWQEWLSPSGQYTHLHGQIFSGLLWDLRQVARGGKVLFDQLVMRTIGHLPPESGFEDFLNQLVITDKELNAGLHGSQIQDAVAKRDLSSFLTVNSSGESLGTVNKMGTIQSQQTSSSNSDVPKRKQKAISCGTLGLESSTGQGAFREAWWGLVFASFGLTIHIFRRFVILLNNVYKKYKISYS